MYEVANGVTVKIMDGGVRVDLANFEAEITKETRYSDGKTTITILSIKGKSSNKDFPEVEIQAEKFAGLAWVLPEWGISAVIQPGQTIKEDLRTAIQLNSNPKIETIHTHTGYTTKDDRLIYLHAEGAISKDGNNKDDRVLLPPELKNYIVQVDDDEKGHIIDTLSLVSIAPPEIMWPLIAATIAPLHGPVDFAIHLAGRTGTFKSEIASLLQSHYGPAMDARNLPGSWSSTANALEAQAFRAKNAVFVIDDYIPIGTAWQIKGLLKSADQIIRGQGNQAGRARLTDVSTLQTTMFPRGGIISTGEDTPDGHSVRARMLIIEMTPGDVKTDHLTDAQAMRNSYHYTTGNYIKFILNHYEETIQEVKEITQRLRTDLVSIGHTRTPSTIARLIASIVVFLNYAETAGAITMDTNKELKEQAITAITAVGDKQARYLEEADPTQAFCESIKHILAAHIGHLRTKDGGIPKSAETLGWTREESKGDIPTFKSHGKCIGWIAWDDDEMLIDITAAYSDIRKHAQGGIAISKQTMLKRLKDGGLLSRVDGNRQRNTIRVTCENHPRQVIAMNLAQALELSEIPQDSNQQIN